MPNHVTNLVTISCGDNQRLRHVAKQMVGNSGLFDFNRIVKMPKSLNIVSGSETDIALALVTGKLHGYLVHHYTSIADMREKISKNKGFKSIKRLTKMGHMIVKNKSLYGHDTWYNWSCDKWGTKWNAYSQHFLELQELPSGGKSKSSAYGKRRAKKHIDRYLSDGEVCFEFSFDTAWAMPEPIFDAMAKKFPDIKIHIKYADEDFGSNTGEMIYEGGFLVTADIAPNYHGRTKEDNNKWHSFAFELLYGDVDPRSHGYDENWEYDEKLENSFNTATE